jgi:hypothetical protein
MSNYNISYAVDEEIVKNHMKRLVNQIWKLIPMRENNEDWKYQLELVTMQLIGFQKIFEQIDILIPITKLEGLKHQKTTFRQYRSEIFSVIDMLGGI